MTLVQLPVANQTAGKLALRGVHISLGLCHRTAVVPDRQLLYLCGEVVTTNADRTITIVGRHISTAQQRYGLSILGIAGTDSTGLCVVADVQIHPFASRHRHRRCYLLIIHSHSELTILDGYGEVIIVGAVHQQLTISAVVHPHACGERLTAEVHGALSLGHVVASEAQCHIVSKLALVENTHHIEVVGLRQDATLDILVEGNQ